MYFLLGGSSNDTAGSRRERQLLVRDSNHGHGMPTGFSAPLEMRAIDSDSDSQRSKRSGGSVLNVMQQQMVKVSQMHSHTMMGSQQSQLIGPHPSSPGLPGYSNPSTNGDLLNHNGGRVGTTTNNPNEFFVDVM